MSIYRIPTIPRSDVYATEKTREPSAKRRSPPSMSNAAERYKHLRKAVPANIPLGPTLMWIESLPPEQRPTALLRRFARIANLLAATWADAKAFDACMDSLLTDKRGNRQGFPSDVLAELIALRRYHDLLEDDATWMTVGKRG